MGYLVGFQGYSEIRLFRRLGKITGEHNFQGFSADTIFNYTLCTYYYTSPFFYPIKFAPKSIIYKLKKQFIFLSIVLFCLNIWVCSGQDILSLKTRENFSQKPILDLILVFEHDYNVRFYYKNDWIKSIIIPDVQTGYTLKQILEVCLNSYGLSYMLVQNNGVVILPNDYRYYNDNTEDLVKVIGNPLDKGKYTLNKVEGFVLFGKTGDPIPGAIVTDKTTNKKTATDNRGYYSLNLPGGKTKLEFAFMGLETKIMDADILGPGKLDVELMEAPIAIDAVNVSANSGKNNVERTQMGLIRMDIKSINKLPVLMGEPDVIKSMTLLPGVSTNGEMSSGFNVRGGKTDQNLILLNDAPLYSTSHIFGLFSALIPDAVSSVKLYKGTQPANFGTRVSAVMQIDLKVPDSTNIKGKAGLGILNSTLFVEGPANKNKKLLFLFGGRTTYSNWILKRIPDRNIKDSKTNFYDLIGKVDYKFDRKTNISVFAYNSSDAFRYATINNFKYRTLNAGTNFHHYFSNASSIKSSVTYSNYTSELGYIENPANALVVESGNQQINARFDWSLNLDKHEIMAGAEGIVYTLNPGVQRKLGAESNANENRLDEEHAIETGIYINDNIKLFDKVSLSAGLRYSWYSKFGAGTSYIYDPQVTKNENSVIDSVVHSGNDLIKPYHGLEPRLGVKYALNSSSALKINFSQTFQYQHLISNTASSMPSDYWKSADENIKPLKSDQYAIGYFKNFLDNQIESSIEMYYKTTQNVLEYKNGAVLIMNPNIERDIIEGFSKSYGVELMIRKNYGDLTGWIGYTLSRSLIKTNSDFPEETINNGEFYFSQGHRLHDLSISSNYKLTRRWTIGSSFVYYSGRPITIPEEKYYVQGIPVVRYSNRNAYHLPAYHRLDLAVTYEGFLHKTQKVHPSFTFSIYNVYGHKNIYSVYYKRDRNGPSGSTLTYDLYQLTIIGVPIPSLTLNLSF